MRFNIFYEFIIWAEVTIPVFLRECMDFWTHYTEVTVPVDGERRPMVTRYWLL